jgi:acetyl-CoA acetyltransferase
MSDRPYSVFMDVYAAMCRYHMKRYGTTQRQIAAVAAKNHKHSVHNPLAQFQKAFQHRAGAGLAADRLPADDD